MKICNYHDCFLWNICSISHYSYLFVKWVEYCGRRRTRTPCSQLYEILVRSFTKILLIMSTHNFPARFIKVLYPADVDFWASS